MTVFLCVKNKILFRYAKSGHRMSKLAHWVETKIKYCIVKEKKEDYEETENIRIFKLQEDERCFN